MKNIIAFLKKPGSKRVPRYRSISSLHGAAGSLKEPLSWQKMREIAREERLEAKYKKP